MLRREIKSFVFFDLESTGLTDNPRITEISMIAMNRAAGMEMVSKARKNLWAPGLDEGLPDLPRVQNKITLCIYPMKLVCMEAAEITGLNNDNLYQQKDFDKDTADMLAMFLRRLEPPVCMVAHNGGRYDYPLLCAELQSIGCPLVSPDTKEPLLCIDTFEMYRDLAGDPVSWPNRYLREATTELSDDVLIQSYENQLPCETTPSTVSSRDDDTPVLKKVKLEHDADDDDGTDGVDHSRVRRKLFAEKDADADNASSKEYDSGHLSGSSSPIDIQSDVFEPDTAHQKPVVSKSNGHEPVSNTGDSLSSFSGPITLTGSARPARRIVGLPTKRPSYKLVDLHQRIMGFEPPESHRAEDDCVTLARIFWLTPNAPLWADVNAISFDRFDPLYTVRRRKPLPSGVFPSSS